MMVIKVKISYKIVIININLIISAVYGVKCIIMVVLRDCIVCFICQCVLKEFID